MKRILWMFVVILLWPGPSMAASSLMTGDVIILFDQSHSMQLYSPRHIVGKWLLPRIHTSLFSDGLVVAGFNGLVHPPIVISLDEVKNSNFLQSKLTGKSARGLVTDFEAPLRFLLDYKNEIALALIISDGEPDIWDDHKWFLSRHILADDRYQDLNIQYHDLEKSGYSAQALYLALGSSYTKRNLSFIEERLPALRKKLGKKLVFVDTYGAHDYLKNWAKKVDARYVAARVDDTWVNLDEFYNNLGLPGHESSVVNQQPVTAATNEALTIPPSPASVSAEKVLTKKEGGDSPVAPKPAKKETDSLEKPGKPESTVDKPTVAEPTEDNPTEDKLAVDKLAEDIKREGALSHDVSGDQSAKSVPLYGLVLAVFLTAVVLVLFFLRREKMICADNKGSKELLAKKDQFTSELQQFEAKISEENNRIGLLQSELAIKTRELAGREKEILQEAEKYKEEQFALISQAVSEERTIKFAAVEEEISLRRQVVEEEIKQAREVMAQRDAVAQKEQEVAAKTRELAEREKEIIRQNEESRKKALLELDEELAKKRQEWSVKIEQEDNEVKEFLILKIKEKKAAGLVEIETELGNKRQALEKEIAMMEEASRERIKKWEQEAEDRVVSLLETKYAAQVAAYKKELNKLENQINKERDGATVELVRLRQDAVAEIESEKQKRLTEIKERENATAELVHLRQDVVAEIENEKQKRLAAIKEQENVQRQEVVERIKQDKAEAQLRIQEWEQKERARLKSELNAKYQAS